MAMRGSGVGRYNRMMRSGVTDEPTRKTDARTVRRVARSFKPYWRQVLVVLVAITVVGLLGVVNPLMLKLAITVGFGQQNYNALIKIVAVMIAVPIVSSLIGIGQTYLNTVIGQRVMRDLRMQLYTHLQNMPLKFFTDTRTGEIQSRLSNDIAGVQSVVTETGTSIVSNVTIVLSTLVGMLVLSIPLTILSLGMLPIFIWLTYRVGKVRRVLSKNTQASLADLSVMVEETLSVSGVLLTKTFGRQRQQVKRFSDENEKLVALQIRQQMLGRWFFAFISTFFSITPALVYLLQGYLAFGPGHHADPEADGRDRRHAGRFHHAAEPHVLPHRAAAQRAGGLARRLCPLRPHLRVPRSPLRDRRQARRATARSGDAARRRGVPRCDVPLRARA